MQQPPLTLPFSKSWPASFWGSRGSVPYLPIFSLHVGHLCLHVEPNSLGLEHLEWREDGGMDGRKRKGRKDYSPCCIALIQSPPRSPSGSHMRGDLEGALLSFGRA